MALNSGFDRLVSNTDTFSDWLNKTNEIIDLIREDVVTANSSIANTTGDARIIGSVSTNTLFTETISGGDVEGASDLLINSNTTFSNSSVDVENDLTIGGILNYVVNTDNLNNLIPSSTYTLGNTTNRWVGYFTNTYINGANVEINANTITITGNTLSITTETTFSNVVSFEANASFDDNISTNNLIVAANTSLNNVSIDGEFSLNGTLDINNSDVTANNLVVLGTANIALLEVAGLVANGVALIGTSASLSTSSPTVVDSVPKTQTLGLKYIIQGNNDDASSAYTVEIMCAHNNTTAFYTRYAELNNNFNIVLDPTINGSNLELVATCPNASVSNTHFLNIIRLETR